MLLDRLSRFWTPTSFPVEYHECMAEAVLEGTEEFSRVCPAPAVSVGMALAFKRNPVDAHALGTAKNRSQNFLDVPVGGKDDQLLGLVQSLHPMMPLANSTFLSSEPCQLSRIGCSLPGTMSVAPSASLSKHSTSEGSTSPRRAGE